MEQALDALQQKTATPQAEEAAYRITGIEESVSSLAPALQAIWAGLPAQTLPPATLRELAAFLGNSAMESLLGIESPGPDLTSPRLGAPIGRPAWEISPSVPALDRPPRLEDLAPLSGPGESLAALRGIGGDIAWPAMGGEAIL